MANFLAIFPRKNRLKISHRKLHHILHCKKIVTWNSLWEHPRLRNCPEIRPEVSRTFLWGRGSGGVKSAGVSQSVRETGRDESQSVPCQEKLLKTRDLELPIFEGSVPSCSPHSAGYTRTSVHPYFPVANSWQIERSYPQMSTHISHQRFQTSNQISPKEAQHLSLHSNLKHGWFTRKFANHI